MSVATGIESMPIAQITRRVWQSILEGGYVAQDLVPPSGRTVIVDGRREVMKLDIRNYTYDGKVQLVAARLYQGQTTNFRTAGGGFAPVVWERAGAADFAGDPGRAVSGVRTPPVLVLRNVGFRSGADIVGQKRTSSRALRMSA